MTVITVRWLATGPEFRDCANPILARGHAVLPWYRREELLFPPDNGTRRANRSIEVFKRPLPLDFNATLCVSRTSSPNDRKIT